MKLGDRKQQGRTGEGRTGTNIKETCPACQTHYLRPFYSFDTIEVSKKRKWIKVGKYCPNELCTYCRKDKGA